MYNINIDLEDKCPCMSGKKFKNCCYKNNLLFEVSQGMWLKIDNNYYLEKLLNNKKFKTFYYSAYNKLDRQIFFAIGLDLKSNKSTRQFEFEGKEYYVILVKNKKAKKNEAFEILHEIQHLLCGAEGFPSLTYDSNLGTYPQVLMNIIADPIVNRILINKKFNMKDYYSFGQNYHYDVIDKYPNKLTRYHNLWIIFVAIEKLLDGEFVGINKDSNKIYILIKNKYPYLINEIDKIYNYIKSKNYYEKDIAFDIYSHLVKYYNLQNEISIIY